MKRWLYVGLAVLCIWLLMSGRLELLLLSLLGLGGAGSAKLAKDCAEKKKAVDVASEEMKTTIGNARDLLAKHKEEVRELEAADYGSADIGTLIDGANERERKRNSAVAGRKDGDDAGGDLQSKGSGPAEIRADAPPAPKAKRRKTKKD